MPPPPLKPDDKYGKLIRFKVDIPNPPVENKMLVNYVHRFLLTRGYVIPKVQYDLESCFDARCVLISVFEIDYENSLVYNGGRRRRLLTSPTMAFVAWAASIMSELQYFDVYMYDEMTSSMVIEGVESGTVVRPRGPAGQDIHLRFPGGGRTDFRGHPNILQPLQRPQCVGKHSCGRNRLLSEQECIDPRNLYDRVPYCRAIVSSDAAIELLGIEGRRHTTLLEHGDGVVR